MALGCDICKTGLWAIIVAIPAIGTAEGAAKAAGLILGFLDKHGVKVPKEDIIKLIISNIEKGPTLVAKLICEKVGVCK